jgi:putative tryptophan/tyrosine transport system substrate-binding protein
MVAMRRRDFIKVVAGSVAVWPLGVRAQQAGKQPIIGFLGSNELAWSSWTAAFVQRMRELGWIKDRPIAIEYRWSEARPERVAEVAAEFVRLKVDVIVSYGTAVPALREATSTIPIVFAIAIDPAGAGIVPSLARPGGNVTGLSIEQTEAAGKRLELLRAVLPHLHRLAVIANVANPQTKQEIGAVQTAARALGLELAPLAIRRAEDVATSFAALKGQADALHIAQDTLTNANRTQILTFALGARLPTIVSSSDFVKAGALMSYGPNYPALFRRAAEYVDKILRGAIPGEIPVEQPTKFDLVINLTTAKAIGLALPESVLLRADEVIE